MSTWATFRTAIEAAFLQALTPALRTTVSVNWEGGAREFGSTDGRLLIDVLSYVEEHVQEAEVDEALLSSSNLVTLQVVAESQHDSADLNALRLIENFRLGLRKESVTAILDAAGISLLEAPMSPQRLPTVATGRKISAYAFDVQLRATFSLTPEADDAIGLLEHVEAAATLTNPGASDVTYDVAADDPTPEP